MSGKRQPVEPGSGSRHWDVRLRRVRLLINATLVVDALALPAMVAGTLLGLALYAGRRLEAEAPVMAACNAAALLLPCMAAWLQVRGKWFRRRDVAAFLDERLGLNAALSAREEWGGALAAPPRRGEVPLRLRSVRSLAWLTGGVLMALAGAWLPLPTREEVAAPMPELPPSLAVVERAVEAMEAMADVREQDLEELREQLESLQRKTAAEMYSHAGLEAADALQEKTASALMSLESQLERAGSSLAPLARGQGAAAASLATLREALTAMDSLELRPGGDLGRQLQQLCSDAAVRELDAASARRLRERLAQSSRQLRELGGRCGWCSVVSPDGAPGMCCGGAGGEEQGVPGDGPSSGGASRGRGDAPLAFRGEERERLGTTGHRLENFDPGRAALSDVIGVEQGAPPPANGAAGIERGGSAAQPARGGDAVWHDALTPAERSALKVIFL